MVNTGLPPGNVLCSLKYSHLTKCSLQVTQILLTSKTNSVPYTATGINFVHTNSSSSPIFSAYARKEVILAAGAIATPKLLQLSGIGDRDILEPLGIDMKINLRTVGRNFQDQVRVSAYNFISELTA